MNTNTNLSFLQSHSFPFFNRQISNKDLHSDSFADSSFKKSLFYTESRSNLRSKYLQKERIEKTKQCCKRFFTFLFSHIGLSAILVGYVIIGGFMFQSLEISNEINTKKRVKDHRNDFIKATIKNLISLNLTWNNTDIMNNSSDINKSGNQTLLNNYLTMVIINYTNNVIFFMQEEGWNGNDDVTALNWSYEGALLYVLTVITTIGYGHVAPKTKLGKFITMLYALLGIPLTFLYLSNIGDYLADWFRFIYHKVCRKYCKMCCQKSRKHHSGLRSKLIKANAFPGMSKKVIKRDRPKQMIKPNNFFDKSIKQLREKLMRFPLKTKKSDDENPSRSQHDPSDCVSTINSQNDKYIFKSYGVARFLPSVKTIKQREALMMNCVSTHVPLINWRDIDKDLEIGSLDNIPHVTDHSDCIRNPYLSTSDFYENQESFNNKPPDELSELHISTSFSQKKESSLYKSLPYLTDQPDTSAKNSSSTPYRSNSFTPDINFVTESIRQVSYVSVNNIMEIENEVKSNNHKTVKLRNATVPISLSLTVIWIYIIIGAIIFTVWGDLDFLKWSYFCFITLSTIGFGDIVPGTKVDSKNPKEKLIIVSIYVIIGLSVFAMCFKLMQEEVVAKFKRLGRKLGVWKSKVKKHKNHDKTSELILLPRSK